MLGEGGRGAQLPPTGLLLLSNRQRPPQSSLCFTPLPQGQQHLAPQTIQFSFKKLFACYFCCLNCLVKQIEANLRLAEARVGRGDMAKIHRAPLGRHNSVAHKLDPALGITASGQQRSLSETCPVRGICDPMLGAVGYRFISMSCGPLWITT